MNCVTWDSWTPLHEAVEKHHAHMVDYLLSKGADTTIRTLSGGQTPLEMAVFLECGEIIKLFEVASQVKGEGQAHSTDLPLRFHKRRASGDQDVERYPKKDTKMTSDDQAA